MHPTQEQLNNLFEYRDGMIFWKIKPSKRIRIHSRAGCIQPPNNYRRISINRINYLEHRIIWIMINGKVPEGKIIDHIDNNPLNNDIDNLRMASYSNNSCNSPIGKSNSSGLKGASFDSYYGKWRASICIKGKSVFLGNHDSAELAHLAYQTASVKYHGEFANFG